MYEIKLNSTYMLTLYSSLIFCALFNLLIRNEVDFSYVALDIYDVKNIIIQDKHIVVTTVILNRLKQLLLIIVLMKAFGGKRIYNITMIILGGLFGFIISIQQYYLGISGIIILLAYIFPHYLIYIMAMVYENASGLYEVVSKDNIKKIFVFCVIFAIGVIIECIFMTFFLKNFHQYMVS